MSLCQLQEKTKDDPIVLHGVPNIIKPFKVLAENDFWFSRTNVSMFFYCFPLYESNHITQLLALVHKLLFLFFLSKQSYNSVQPSIISNIYELSSLQHQYCLLN